MGEGEGGGKRDNSKKKKNTRRTNDIIDVPTTSALLLPFSQASVVLT